MGEPATNASLKILLVDDQRLFAESLRTFLSNYSTDMTVQGIAANGKEAVHMVNASPPDVVLMDVRMPEMDGVVAVRYIKATHPEVKIIMLSTYDEDQFVRAALLGGASGYLLKDISPTELITAIRALQNNVVQISPELVRNMVMAKYTGEAAPPPRIPGFNTLSKRERETFALLATGYDNDQISEKLFVAPQTVRNQVSAIYDKLGVKDRFEIIRLANRK